MAPITGQAIREELARWGLIALLGETDAASSAADRLRDTIRLQSVSLASTAFNGAFVRMSAGTKDGEQSRIDRLDQDNGDLYVSPDFTGTVPDDSTYEIWAHGVDPDDADRARDQALTKICSQWALMPLSEIPNADFETAVVDPGSADWTDDGTSTIDSQVLSFPTEFARHSLLVTAVSGANEFAESASMYVQPGQVFYLYAPVSVRVGGATIVVRDITNSANITLTGTATATLRGWTAFEVTFTVPSGCGEIQIRLQGNVGATDVTEWGPVHLHRTDQKKIDLPPRIDSRNYIGPIWFIRNAANAADLTQYGMDYKEEVVGAEVEQIGDSVQVRLENGMSDAPYFFSERIFYTALSAVGYLDVADRTAADAATTLCPIDYVVAGTVRLLAEQYINRPGQDVEFWARLHHQALIDLSRFEKEFGPKPLPRQERTRTTVVPHLRI